MPSHFVSFMHHASQWPRSELRFARAKWIVWSVALVRHYQFEKCLSFIVKSQIEDLESKRKIRALSENHYKTSLYLYC